MEHPTPPLQPTLPPYSEEALEPFLPRSSATTTTTTTTSPPPRAKPGRTTRPRVLTALGGIAVTLTLLLLLKPPPLHVNHNAQRSNATLYPIVVAGGGGADNWTLPLPPLPLTPAAMARTCRAVQHRGQHGHSHGHHDYYSVDASFDDPTAGRTLTYSLATTSAVGIGASLLEVFTAFGLAQAEGRRFVLDDAAWAWGRWRDHFDDTAAAAAATDARGAALPCPHSAASLAVAHATRGWAFGHAFTEHFELPRERGSRRQRRVFALARAGVDALLHARPQLAATVRERARRLTELAGSGDGAWVAIHVRRGDYRPRTWSWLKRGGVPLDAVADVAAVLSAGRGRVLVVSDDPAVLAAPELAGSFPAMEGDGLLAGGYAARKVAGLSSAERRRLVDRWLEDVLVVRELVTRGPPGEGGVVCAGNSATCRLLAVVVGWDAAIEKDRWRDVDGGIGWSGVNW